MSIRHWRGRFDEGLAGAWVPLSLAAMAAAGGAVLAVSLSAHLPGWALALVGLGALVLATAVEALLIRLTPRLRRAAGLRVERLRSAVHRRRLRRMSGRVLGERWATSAIALVHEPSCAGRAKIAARRAEYLSEMERRDPLGFARWMAEDPLATDPRGYLTPQTR